MFHVGQHVVCVKRGKWSNAAPVEMGEVDPVYGQVLTVRTVTDEHDGTWLRFEEIRNPVIRHDDDGSLAEGDYCSKGFRPLQDSRLDIFRQLLVTSPKQGVDA